MKPAPSEAAMRWSASRPPNGTDASPARKTSGSEGWSVPACRPRSRRRGGRLEWLCRHRSRWRRCSLLTRAIRGGSASGAVVGNRPIPVAEHQAISAYACQSRTESAWNVVIFNLWTFESSIFQIIAWTKKSFPDFSWTQKSKLRNRIDSQTSDLFF